VSYPPDRGGADARQAPIAKLGPNFRSDPDIAPAIRAAGVSLCCLANNHVYDQGPAGLSETIATLDAAGLPRTGAGADQTEACKPFSATINGLRVAIINYGIVEGAVPGGAPIARFDAWAVSRAVAAACQDHNVVVPVLHIGKEEVPFPSPGNRGLCRHLIDAGAAAVVCHHPHVPQGMEIYHDRPIAYSLGNFLFDWHEPEPHTDSSFLLELELSDRGVAAVAVYPFAKTAAGGVRLLWGKARAKYLGLIEDLSAPLAEPDLADRLWAQQSRTVLSVRYNRQLARGANIESADPAARTLARLTFLNVMEDAEHGESLKYALRAQATGDDPDDERAQAVIDDLNRRFRRAGGATA
jgi:hypothetical protein